MFELSTSRPTDRRGWERRRNHDNGAQLSNYFKSATANGQFHLSQQQSSPSSRNSFSLSLAAAATILVQPVCNAAEGSPREESMAGYHQFFLLIREGHCTASRPSWPRAMHGSPACERGTGRLLLARVALARQPLHHFRALSQYHHA